MKLPAVIRCPFCGATDLHRVATLVHGQGELARFFLECLGCRPIRDLVLVIGATRGFITVDWEK